MASSKNEIVESIYLDELGPIYPIKIGPQKYRIDNRINLMIKELEQKRIMLYHYVIHILAFIILIPYVVLICCGIQIPDSYSTIISVVIGFYFAKSLFNNNSS